jgi:hypothetical protein
MFHKMTEMFVAVRKASALASNRGINGYVIYGVTNNLFRSRVRR